MFCLDQPSKFLTHSACLICRSFVGLLTRYNTSNVRRYVQKSRPMGEQWHRKMPCVCRLTPRIHQLQSSELQNTSLIARILKIRFTHMLHPDSKFPKFWLLFRKQNFLNILPILTSFKSCGLFCYKLIWPKGPSINNVASLEGGRGGRIDDMGQYEGVCLKENPISSIQDWQIMIFFF